MKPIANSDPAMQKMTKGASEMMRILFILLTKTIPWLFALGLVGCVRPFFVDLPIPVEPTPIVQEELPDPTPLPPPLKSLIVCLNEEPRSLFLYDEAFLFGEANLETNAVFQAIYDGPIDYVGYNLQPVILERIPDIESGQDASFQEVLVLDGEVYFNPTSLLAENLTPGKPYLPVGCRDSGCAEQYSGGEVTMEQMVVEFHLLPELKWSDGSPLTSHDSVFSFEIDRAAETATTKYLPDRTAAYQAIDETTVQWTGIPGFFDEGYSGNFWHPLPRHQLGDFAPGELQGLEQAAQMPLGWGPYVLEEWQSGGQMILRPNPNYHRGDEGLPTFELLLYRFIGPDIRSAVQQLITGECDILDESLVPGAELELMIGNQTAGGYELYSTPGNEIERLDFNLAPLGTESPPFFSDVRVRQGIAACIDREAIITEIFDGRTITSDTYISPLHPGFSPDGDPIVFDQSTGAQLLTEAGWIDDDQIPETPRVAVGVTGISNGTELSFPVLSTAGSVPESILERVQSDLLQCGVGVEPVYQAPEELFAPFPDGPVFGRTFSMVGWPWLEWIYPLCEMFMSTEIPSDTNPFGINASGFQDRDYDQACQAMLLTYPGAPGYSDQLHETQVLFRESLPGLPLYVKPRWFAARNEVCGISMDPIPFSQLWGLEQYDIGSACENRGE